MYAEQIQHIENTIAKIGQPGQTPNRIIAWLQMQQRIYKSEDDQQIIEGYIADVRQEMN